MIKRQFLRTGGSTTMLALLGLLFVPQALANKYQDLWWDPAESGWGVNITHQEDVLFATLFIYGLDNEALWLVMPNGQKVSGSGEDDTYIGVLHVTSGPAYNAPSFDPLAVTRTTVGTATFMFHDDYRATLSYVVNGELVTKNIVRQTYRFPEMEGFYQGTVERSTLCTGPGGGTGAAVLEDLAFHIDPLPPDSIEVEVREGGQVLCTNVVTFEQHGKLTKVPTNPFVCGGTMFPPGAELRGHLQFMEGALVGKFRTDFMSGPDKCRETFEFAAIK